MGKVILRILLFALCLSSGIEAATVTLQLKRPNHSLLMRSSKDFIEFRPNANVHWGIKISGDFFYIEYGAKIADTNYGTNVVAPSDYESYRIGLPIKNLFIGLYYQQWQGFSSNESNCDFCDAREDLKSRNGSINLVYAFEKDFSMKALNSNGSEGVKFNHSWLATIFYDRLKVSDNGGLVQNSSEDQFLFFTDLRALEMRQAGAGLGYGVTAPFGPLYFAAGAVIGAGYQDNRRWSLENIKSKNTGAAIHWNSKINLATHGDGLNFGVKGFFFSNIYEVTGSKNVMSLNYNLYVYTSYTW